MVPYETSRGRINILRHHLAAFHASETQCSLPTGMELVKRAGLKCVLGERCVFRWRSRIVVLRPEIAHGTGPASVVIAAHEIAHSQQPRWWFAFLILAPVRWWIEVDCWNRTLGPC